MNPVMYKSVLNKNEVAINKLMSSRKRVVKLLIILLLLFIFSWVPYHINTVLIDIAAIWELNLGPGTLDATRKTSTLNFVTTQTLIEQLFPISLCLALANSAANPVCLIGLSQNFRDKFKASYCRWFK